MGLTTSCPASNKPHLAEKYSGLASNLAYLGRICYLAAASRCCPTGYPASNKPHLAEKYSGLASNLTHLGRIC